MNNQNTKPQIKVLLSTK